ncbi:MAG: AtpZ/AtpI family protein [Candidatus Omnitrophica bacterium]|nr:AtpZ/AtpI family protein [Candidatus Omnitrophota bacterium]
MLEWPRFPSREPFFSVRGFKIGGQDKLELLKQVAAISTVPFLLVGGPLVGYFAGNWLDHRYAWDPYGKLFLILFGLAASILEITQIIRRVLNSEK